MSRWMIGFGILISLGIAACETCLREGSNGVGDPAEDEFQLVLSLRTERDTPVFVDGKEVGVVCESEENVVIGNYPISKCSLVMIHNRVNEVDCFLSPNCSNDCSSSQNCADPCLDSRLYAGSRFHAIMIWKTW